MNQQLMTTDENRMALAQLAELDLLPAGMENLEPGDTGMPPRLRISQRNRPIEVGDTTAPPGSIVNTLTGETYEHVEIVPVVFLSRTRVMWPFTFSTDNAPECLSDDGKLPTVPSEVRNVTNPQAGPCNECSWAQFSDDGTPPRCKMQRNFLVWLVEQGEPAILTMQSTALKSARHLTTLARTQGLKKSVVFTTREVKSDQGQWHIPAFVKGHRLEPSEILALVEMRDELKNLVVGADIERESEPESELVSVEKDGEEVPF